MPKITQSGKRSPGFDGASDEADLGQISESNGAQRGRQEECGH